MPSGGAEGAGLAPQVSAASDASSLDPGIEFLDSDEDQYFETDNGTDGSGSDDGACAWRAGGGGNLLDANLGELSAYGCTGAWRQTSPSEICVGVEIPYHRFGLPAELAHSLRLEPGSALVIKLRAMVRPEHCTTPLLQPGEDKLLPAIRFSVFKALPTRDAGHMEVLLRRGEAEDATPPACAEFGLRFALQSSLQDHFVMMIAVEDAAWHRPEPISNALSFAYVRNLKNR
eukprot:SAG31_NODE_548_length_14222_cov_10.926574_11_plen_231_part_00